jgi:hypothetical protein
MEKKSTFVRKNREAMGDNRALVLNIEGAVPGGIYAYIDDDVRAEINEQLDKRADTTDIVPPHREGRSVDVVTFRTTLREMFNAEMLSFEYDSQIDAWVAELENLAQYLREFKAERQKEAGEVFCQHCLHSLLDHERPDSGKLSCQHQNCNCSGFFPIESQNLNQVFRRPQMQQSVRRWMTGKTGENANSSSPAKRQEVKSSRSQALLL